MGWREQPRALMEERTPGAGGFMVWTSGRAGGFVVWVDGWVVEWVRGLDGRGNEQVGERPGGAGGQVGGGYTGRTFRETAG